MNYSCKEISRIKTPGCWDQIVVGVFKDENKVGRYIKGYDDNPTKTFQPFVGSDGKDYAVISATDYTLATVISLPDCRVVCVEDNPSPGYGFCPVEIWIPKLYKLKDYPDSGYFSMPTEEGEDLHSLDIKLPTFAFVQGCVWGDDSSYKLEIYDLRDALNKISRLQPFGYLEMADGHLKDLIEIYDETNGTVSCKIKSLKWERFNL